MDFRLAWRSITRNPGFSAVVIVTLALGIGATTALFSLVRAVFLKPLPFSEQDRLVTDQHLALSRRLGRRAHAGAGRGGTLLPVVHGVRPSEAGRINC